MLPTVLHTFPIRQNESIAHSAVVESEAHWQALVAIAFTSWGTHKAWSLQVWSDQQNASIAHSAVVEPEAHWQALVAIAFTSWGTHKAWSLQVWSDQQNASIAHSAVVEPEAHWQALVAIAFSSSGTHKAWSLQLGLTPVDQQNWLAVHPLGVSEPQVQISVNVVVSDAVQFAWAQKIIKQIKNWIFERRKKNALFTI